MFKTVNPKLNVPLIEHVRAHLAGRLHLSGVLNQRLALMPFDLGHPIWVNADDIDLERPRPAETPPATSSRHCRRASVRPSTTARSSALQVAT